MALGDNQAFFNETTFELAGDDTFVTGASGIKSSDGSPAKLLFNYDQADPTPTATSLFVTTSAAINDVIYEMKIDIGYNALDFAVINSDRLATQFTFNQSLSTQTLSAQGHNSVGPTLRRLYQLGYV